jgi:hypothetical protein
MRPGLQDPATLLAAWEAGERAPEPVRGAAVLEAVDGGAWLDRTVPEVAVEAARALAGTLALVLTCGQCGTVLDLELPVAEMVGTGVAAVERELSSGPVSVRCPTGRDLLAAAGRPDARDVLLERCVVGGQAFAAEDLELVEEAFDELAGDAVPEVQTQCPECGEQVIGVVDAARLLWQQVAAIGPGLLQEVAALAAAYGWTEPEILALSPARRNAYLRLADR